MTTIHRQAAPPPSAPAKSPAPLTPRLEYFNSHHTESRNGKLASQLRLTVPFVAGIAAVVAILLATYLVRGLSPARAVNWRWLGQSVRDCVVFAAFSTLLFALALNRDAFAKKDVRRRLPLFAMAAGAAQALTAVACIRANDLIDASDDVVMIVTLLLILVYPVLVALLLGRLAKPSRQARY
jgi:hypothetical protein